MAPAAESTWKRVLRLTAWFWLMPPIGLWKLVQDPVLSRDAKWRVVIYACIIPVLAYFIFSLYGVNAALKNFP